MIHENGDESGYKVEAMISLWNISKAGTLMKYKEQRINYPYAYQDCLMEHMRLNLSDDKKYVCLTTSDAKDHSSKINFCAWTAKSLKPLILKKKLVENLNTPIHGSIRSIRFVGNSFYILKEFVVSDVEQQDPALKQQYVVWQLFDVNTGKKVFERNNKYVST